jgi:hypothetical protein
MATITFKINERSKAGKTFMQMKETFFTSAKGIKVIENDKDKESKTIKKTAKRDAFLNDLKIIGKDCRDIKNSTSKKEYQSMQSFLDGI